MIPMGKMLVALLHRQCREGCNFGIEYLFKNLFKKDRLPFDSAASESMHATRAKRVFLRYPPIRALSQGLSYQLAYKRRRLPEFERGRLAPQC